MAESRILVVDSSAVSREIVARILRIEIEGSVVTTCGSGAEAMAAIASHHYNLMTTSLLLSDMDGLELCRQLRVSKTHHSIPVIAISGDADERLLKEGFSAGITDYFDKSQGYPEFAKFIKTFCQRNHGMVGRVLFIEDSKTAAMMTMRILEKHGLDITHVLSAEEGLALMQKMHRGEGERFDIVVTDLYLKDEMTGGDLLQVLRKRLHYSQQELPVLMITGNDDTGTQIKAFHAGANDFVAKPLVEEVLMARIRSLLTIKQQYDALEEQAQKMECVASTDSLTGVRNRHYMLEHGEQLLKRAGGKDFWAMIIDIDHFKKINDNIGYLTGDHILAAMGALLNKQFPDAMVVRFGGEEFSVLFSSTSREEAVRRGEVLRAAAEAMQPEGLYVTISIGVAGLEDHPSADLNSLLGLADKALFSAKESGRNRVYLTQGDGFPSPVIEYTISA
jgi:two-component system cell cycle response regulator